MDRSDATEERATAASATSAGQDVAVLDMKRVFAECTTFQAEMDRMKNDLADLETDMLGLKVEAEAIQKALANLAADTPEHIQKTAELAAIGFKVQQRNKEAEREFQERERAALARAFERIRMAVDLHSKATGIKLVIRYNGENGDLSEPKELIETINRPVVFQDGIDITDEIIAAVNHGGPVAQTSP